MTQIPDPEKMTRIHGGPNFRRPTVPDKAVPVSGPEARPALQLSAVPGGDHTSQHIAHIPLPARKTVLRVFGCAIRLFSFINIVGKAEFRIRDVVERIRIRILGSRLSVRTGKIFSGIRRLRVSHSFKGEGD